MNADSSIATQTYLGTIDPIEAPQARERLEDIQTAIQPIEAS